MASSCTRGAIDSRLEAYIKENKMAALQFDGGSVHSLMLCLIPIL